MSALHARQSERHTDLRRVAVVLFVGSVLALSFVVSGGGPEVTATVGPGTAVAASTLDSEPDVETLLIEQETWFVAATRGPDAVMQVRFDRDSVTVSNSCSELTIPIEWGPSQFQLGRIGDASLVPLESGVICVEAGLGLQEGQTIAARFNTDEEVLSAEFGEAVVLSDVDNADWLMRLMREPDFAIGTPLGE